MRHMGGAKEHIPWANRGRLVLDPVPTGAGGDEIEFVALVRNLRAVCGSRSEPYLEVTVNEHLGRSPFKPRTSR